MATITSVCRAPIGPIRDLPETRQLLEMLLSEVGAVARACGYDLAEARERARGLMGGLVMGEVLDDADRLLAFADDHPIGHLLGAHIEMTRTPGRDYPVGATYQPDEVALPMTVDQLAAVRDAAASIPARAGRHVFDDFIIVLQGPA
jgi:hypothetical protein